MFADGFTDTVTESFAKQKPMSEEYRDGYLDSLESCLIELQYSITLNEARAKLLFRKRLAEIIIHSIGKL